MSEAGVFHPPILVAEQAAKQQLKTVCFVGQAFQPDGERQASIHSRQPRKADLQLSC